MIPTTEPAAVRWLDALDDPESKAWDDLDRLEDDLDRDHPIRLAVDFLDPTVDLTERRNASTPTMAYCAERVRTQPGAFARLVLELARSPLAIQVAERSAGLRVQHCRLFLHHRPRLAALTGAFSTHLRRWIPTLDEQAGRIYHDAYRAVLGDGVLENGDASNADPETREILATILELEVNLLASRFHALSIGYTLDRLLPLLDDCPIPGRRSSALWRLGRHLVSIDRDAEAVDVLREAEAELPDDLDLSLRLRIVHMRAYAEAVLGRFDAAAHFLDRAAPLMDRWGNDGILAQRLHLLGHLAREAGHHEEAEACWVESFELNCALGRHADAVQTTKALERLRAEREDVG